MVVQTSGSSAAWVVIGIIVGALVVLLLLWMFWLQPVYFPQVQILTVPQTQQPAQPNINIQGGQGGSGGTGGTGTGGTGTGGTGGSSSTTP